MFIDKKKLDLKIKSEYFYFLSEGLRLKVFFCRPKNREKLPLVIVNHGGGGMSSLYEYFCQDLALQNFAAAVMTYRGYHPSEGSQEYGKGEINDIINLIAELSGKNFIDENKIGLFGYSRGGHHALLTAAKIPLKAVAAWSAPTDLFDLYNCHPLLLTGIIGGSPSSAENEYCIRSPIFFMDKIQAPVLIIHGKEDKVVPVSHAYKLVRVLEHQKKLYKLYILDNEEHSFSYNGLTKSWNITVKFLKKYLS